MIRWVLLSVMFIGTSLDIIDVLNSNLSGVTQFSVTCLLVVACSFAVRALAFSSERP
jgi:hypothetical protein